MHKRCTSKLVELGLGLPDIVTHHDCVNNEMVSLCNRHLVDKLPYPDWLQIHPNRVVLLRPSEEVVPGYTQTDILALRAQVAKRWIDNRRVDPISYLDVINQFTGAKRRALHRAHHNNRFSLPRGQVEAFIKVDLYDEESATVKPPRMIQYRGPAFNLELARWLTPAEETLLHGPGLGPTRLPSSSKGMTPIERGQMMVDKRYHFQNPVAVCMDYSAFDSTNFAHLLDQEWDVWKAMCPGLNAGLISAQFVNRCRTKNGIRYTSAGTRMSGDRNTGGGNSVCNILNFYTICEAAGIQAEFICDGDDSVAWMEADDVPRFLEYSEAIVGKVFGMILRDCQTVYSSDDEYYCQHKNILTSSGVSLPTRDPIRILTRLPWTAKGVRGVEAADLLLAKCIGEMIVSRHIGPLARLLQRIARSLDPVACTLDSGAAQEHIRTFEMLRGTKFSTEVLDETIEDDPVALGEIERIYALPNGFLSSLDNVQPELHPSIVAAGRMRRRHPPAEVMPCAECDLSHVSR